MRLSSSSYRLLLLTTALFLTISSWILPTTTAASAPTQVTANLRTSAHPPRFLRLAKGDGGVRHKVLNEFIAAIMMGVAIGAVLGVTLCVVKCQGSRVCPCLCGEEAREEKETLAEEEDILAEGNNTTTTAQQKTEEVTTGAVDEEAKDAEKEEEEEGIAAAVPAVLKSLSTSLLGLLGMSGTNLDQQGEEAAAEKKKQQTLLEMAGNTLEEESKQQNPLIQE